MYRLTSLVGLLLPLVVASACQQRRPVAAHPPIQQAPTGVFVGLAEIEGMPPEKPGDKWYHENIVYIRPDSLFLEGNPIIISQDGEKTYSASDGGFYSFSGRIDTTAGNLMAKLLVFRNEYSGLVLIYKDSIPTNSKLSDEELVRQGLARVDSSFYRRRYTITLIPKGFERGGVRYVRLPADSLPNVFPVGFPASERFFGKYAKLYGR